MKLKKITLHEPNEVLKDSEMKQVLGGSTRGGKIAKCYQDYEESWKAVENCDRETVKKACGFEPGSHTSCA